MKKILSILTSTIITVLMVSSVSTTKAEANLRYDFTIYVNNEQVNFPDQKPYIDTRFNRTYVPIRFVTEALGANVHWYEERKEAAIHRQNQWVIVKPGSNRIHGTVKSNTIDAPVKLEHGRIMVPLKFVSEALESTVKWDNVNRRVLIIDENIPSTYYKEKIEQALGVSMKLNYSASEFGYGRGTWPEREFWAKTYVNGNGYDLGFEYGRNVESVDIASIHKSLYHLVGENDTNRIMPTVEEFVSLRKEKKIPQEKSKKFTLQDGKSLYVFGSSYKVQITMLESEYKEKLEQVWGVELKKNTSDNWVHLFETTRDNMLPRSFPQGSVRADGSGYNVGIVWHPGVGNTGVPVENIDTKPIYDAIVAFHGKQIADRIIPAVNRIARERQKELVYRGHETFVVNGKNLHVGTGDSYFVFVTYPTFPIQ
ncbi:copper amine oxidase N-terminal domain-containing protein [Heliorestis acidaminivorans]|uniref:Copper amine oxidase N-terminal domain-containing protein n=1 Tax=Heliorestis acidaminivorans TaxID=553427 RepID=A0A6I0F1H7_9FIRM|nr:copper amine oxidase N-terminal domain-containing protein [Heliorestis acidaminivorans]KAB2952019.1 copper amine oxidase N-terminal domain-containing protein [Heliorestis acidaminivorans]